MGMGRNWEGRCEHIVWNGKGNGEGKVGRTKINDICEGARDWDSAFQLGTLKGFEGLDITDSLSSQVGLNPIRCHRGTQIIPDVLHAGPSIIVGHEDLAATSPA